MPISPPSPAREVREEQQTCAAVPQELLEVQLQRERALRTALETALGCGVAIIDPEGRQTEANRWFCKLIGWEPHELIGARMPFVYWPPEDAEHIQQALRKEAREPSADGVPLRFRRRDGEDLRVQARVHLLEVPSRKEPSWLVLIEDARGRQQAEEEHLRLLRERAQLADHLGLLLESTAEGIYGVDREGRCTFINRSAARRLGYSPGELLGKGIHALIHHTRPDGSPYPEEDCPLCRPEAADQGGRRQADVFWARDGVSFPAECASHAIVQGGQRLGAVVSFVDISERVRLEEQARQSQKMEAIGRMAGGVAHDFNNLLTIISGYVELMLESLAQQDPVRENALEIQRAAERASALTRQLLIFSRKQVVSQDLLPVNNVISDLKKMLCRVIGEDVECVTRLNPSAGYVRADRSQYEQVILNLAVNARDAMPDGGTLILETTAVELDRAYVRTRPALKAGPYVLLQVSDTGCGMSQEVQAHIFEPFFTTKEQGKGTGLGLSTVYAIVKQNEGHIEVSSAPGQGTSFRIYLPRVSAPPASSSSKSPSLPPRSGKSTVLLVEDEDAVRRLIVMVLRWNGHTVLEAATASEAMTLCKEHPGPIDLLVTDVIMPQMNGRELADHLLRLRHDLKVLFISGYTGGVLGDRGVLEDATDFLPKPFTPDQLARKVADVLETESAPAT